MLHELLNCSSEKIREIGGVSVLRAFKLAFYNNKSKNQVFKIFALRIKTMSYLLLE